MACRHGDDAGVADVVGSILLVAVTVIAAAGFGLILLAFDGPPDTQHTRLVATVTTGAGGWGGGDEELRVAHVGGEALRRSATTISVATPAGPQTLTGAALGAAFADGALTVGETWTHRLTAQVGDPVGVRVAVEAGRSQLLTSSTIVAGSSGGPLCLGDLTAPTVAWTQAPADVTSLTSGAVTVTAALSDSCSGVDAATLPRIHYCIAVTCVVPTSYTDGGAMTATGGNRWSANIPHPGPWIADGIAGRSLRYYVSPLADQNGNAGASPIQVDLVDLVATYTYVVSAAATTGSVANLGNAQGAANGVEATLAEGAVTGAPGSAGPTRVAGASVVNGGALTPTNALASDDARTEFDTTGDFIEVSGFDLPANAASVTAVTLGYEGRKSQNGGTSPTSRIDYRIGAAAYVTGSSISESATVDTDRTRALSGITSVADVEAMTVRIFYVTDTNRNLQVDQVFALVTYTTTPQTNYRIAIELEWTGIPAGTLQSAELRYRTEADTFTVQAYNFVTLAWRTCSGTLSSAALASYSCALQANEVSSGEVRLRILDSTPAGTAQGRLFLDHARTATA